MRKSRNKSFVLMFIFAVVAIQFPVSLALSDTDEGNEILNEGGMISSDYLSSELSDSLQSDKAISEKTLDTKLSIFDEDLRQELK
jgi:hypothetical protein